jgi:hypothetical protein
MSLEGQSGSLSSWGAWFNPPDNMGWVFKTDMMNLQTTKFSVYGNVDTDWIMGELGGCQSIYYNLKLFVFATPLGWG